MRRNHFLSELSLPRKTMSSESSFYVEGGTGTTKRNEASNKTRKESTTKGVTEDGWEEEIYEEYSP